MTLPPVLRLLLVLLLCALPAALLVAERLRFESSEQAKTYTLVMDYPALAEQAAREGQEPLALLLAYRQQGVGAVAVYQDTLATLQARGEVLLLRGSEAQALYPEADFRASLTYAASRTQGAAEAFAARLTQEPALIEAGGRTWLGFPEAARDLPGGAPQELIKRLEQAGFVVMYRPRAHRALRDPLSELPAVPYIAFAGSALPVADEEGGAARLAQHIEGRIPAFIEGANQTGMAALMGQTGAVRMFSLSADWQATLPPSETASKYVLAARERGHRLLYIRPYAERADTEQMLAHTLRGLERAGLRAGLPQPREFSPNPLLRALSMLGPLLALAMLALSVPLRSLGVVAALGTLGLCLLVNAGNPYAAFALLASLTFPALGFALLQGLPAGRHPRSVLWAPRGVLWASLISLLGAVFVVALGSTGESMMGLHPFRGVGLTLLVPLLLFALTLLPRQDIRHTLAGLFRRPLTLGDLALAGLALVVVAVSVLRRGNDPIIGVSSAELELRTALQDSLIRPRFKEFMTHPLAMLGLSGQLPAFSGLLLLGGVIGQASILNTFAHFHTPLLISAQRVLNGLLIGVLLGLLALAVLKILLAWWSKAPPAGTAAAKNTAEGPAITETTTGEKT